MPTDQARGQRRYERILDAALDVFSRKGYHATAVDEVASESETSKGGVYFHFPNKQTLFLALLDRMAALLRSRVEAAISAEPDPVAKADMALQVVLQTFASHRTLSRLFFVEALGAGPEFTQRMAAIRASFADLIEEHLREAVRQGAIPPLDTRVASRVWFGALDEVVTSWVLADPPGRLEDTYPTVRALLLRSIGAQLPAPSEVSAVLLDGTRDGHVRSAPVGWSPTDALMRLRGLAERARERARAERRSVLASLVVPAPSIEPLAFFAAGAEVAADRHYWARPRTAFALAAVGSAAELASEAERFELAIRDVQRRWEGLVRGALVEAPADTIGVGPLLVGGFAFDPQRLRTEPWSGFPAARLDVPATLLTLVDGATWLTLNLVVVPETDVGSLASEMDARLSRVLAATSEGAVSCDTHSARQEDVLPAETWQTLVASARDEVRRGVLEKVVLARAVRVQADGPIDAASTLYRLQSDYPSCFVFAATHGGASFVGATPERLVRLRGKLVSTMCLAGSVARGRTPAEDHALGEQLLGSEKERTEHDIVVRGLRTALADACDEIAPISTPVLLKVRNVQHLLTTVVGRIAEGRTILDVVERLHPTPAVGGFPREAALAWIRERERLDRGWYAGPIGWLDMTGEGEFAVGIRSGLLRGDEATLFAGCGIVADSDPESEYTESRLKLRPMLSALGVTQP